MPKPDPFELGHLINIHREEFVRFELWVSDELTQHLIRDHNLAAAYTTVVVDLDEENPMSGVSGSQVILRMNGRFYIPTADKQGVKLDMSPEDWVASAQEWFDENEVDVEFDEDSKDLVKFTAMVDAITLPGETEGGEEPEEEPAEEDEGEEPVDEPGGAEPMEEEPAEEEDAGSGGGPPSDEEDDLKEFEKSLGL